MAELKMIKITDDFLSTKYWNEFHVAVMGPFMNWSYLPCKVDLSKEDPKKVDGRMVHIAYQGCMPQSPFFDKLFPIMEKLDVIALVRAKFNLENRTKEKIKSIFHIDMGPDFDQDIIKTWTTSILYVNTNNGYTEFEDGTVVESVANRLVSFPANTKHRGVTCTDEQVRVVLNLNYIPSTSSPFFLKNY